MKYDCLIIDDELALAESTSEYFNMFDVKSTFKTNYEEGLEFLKTNQVSLLLLDINLDNRSGFDLCKEFRKISQIPIFFISARQSDDDVLIALGIGGDDYIKKPYTLSILLAKVKAMIKRCNNVDTSEIIEIDDIKIDTLSSKVTIGSETITLKSMEFKLFLYLARNKNKTITKDELFENVWGGGIVSDSTLNVHIRHIREKIENNPNEPKYIKTVWGIGYILENKQ